MTALRTPLVLIVDDNEQNLKLARDVLRRRSRVEQREDVPALPSHRRLRAREIRADDDHRRSVREEAGRDLAHRPD